MRPGLAWLHWRALVGVSVGAMVVLSVAAPARAGHQDASQPSPYRPSSVIRSITWHWETLRTAAAGSDLWPVTWADDGDIYTAWGDGGGFGGTDSDGRVSLGFARIQGAPDSYRAVNVNGGKNAENPASFPRLGKADGLAAVGSTLYAWINLQDGPWPAVNEGLAWSENGGATWTLCPWSFRKGTGRLKPSTFLSFGKAYTSVPARLAGYVYVYGTRQEMDTDFYLGRVPSSRLRDRDACQFFAGVQGGRPRWSDRVEDAASVFRDPHGMVDTATVTYVPALKRYLLTTFHHGPGQLGVFDGPSPWGPWTTVAYYGDWGGMGTHGEGLTCSFPAKWMSPDGRTSWCIFSVYGEGAKQGIGAHDRFNLVKVTLVPRRRATR